MKTTHLQFTTSDNLNLPGLLYEPDIQSAKKAIIWLHGNGGSNVFDGADKFGMFGEEFTKAGYSLFTFNNRGAHQYHTNKTKITLPNEDIVKKYVRTGTAFEVIKECVMDIDAAVQKLEELGYTEFILAGASTGANKICVYNHYQPDNKISKYILLAGGDDTGIYYKQLGKGKFKRLLKKSKKQIEKGKGFEFAPFKKMNNIYGWRGIFDILNPDGDYNCFPYNEVMTGKRISTREPFDYFKRITKPALVIYGANDKYVHQPTEDSFNTLKAQVKDKENFAFNIIPNADHGFSEKEGELMEVITGWLNS